MNYMLSIMTFLPLLGAILLFFIPEKKEQAIRVISAVFTFLTMIISVWIFFTYFFMQSGGLILVERFKWLQEIGISYFMGADGINVPMILLSGIIAFTSVMVSWNIKQRVKEYFILILICLSGVFGVFCSLDLFFFVLFYELASIPIYFLIGIWGGDKKNPDGTIVKKEYSATKLILYLQLGGGLVLIGAVLLYFVSGLNTFDIVALATAKIPYALQLAIFPLIFIGFGIEAGFWPFHTWLPDGHSSAPTAVSMILAGVLLKMGAYGIIRIALNILPEGALFWMKFFVVIALINILYGALCALKQSDLKYIIAYSSISHMGIVIIGIGAISNTMTSINNGVGISGAMYQMFSHGIITALLFAVAGYVYERTHTKLIEEHGGLAAKIPIFASIFILAGLGSLGLPGLSGFVAEFMVFWGSFQIFPVIAILAILGLVITATYILRTAQKSFLGPFNEKYADIKDATIVEFIPLAILSFTMFIFGVFPALLINIMNGSISELLLKFGGMIR